MKERKTTKGLKKMNELIDAVGAVLTEKGHANISAGSVARQAAVTRRTIDFHFGSFDNLVEEYIKKRDFWSPETNVQIQDIFANPRNRGKEDILLLLQNQFNSVLGSRELQNILLWELSENTKILGRISREREVLGDKLFEFVEDDFQKSEIDLRAVMALLISGVYYLVLHAVNNGSTFCGIDINQPSGKERIGTALHQIMDLCYEKLS